VISHEHYDHIGGLQALLDLGLTPTVYVVDSFSSSYKDNVRAYTQLVEVNDPIEILPGIYSTGKLTENFFEQGLIIVSKQGLVLITGCAHPVVSNMAERTVELIEGNLNFNLVMGGFHLQSNSETQIQQIISDLRNMGVMRVMPSHCTGSLAIDQFMAEYGSDCLQGGAGRIIEIKD
jgi:7,8-dihydropterin-6-yl-methyl-4-(beta-D-ribofuranosyl)aminobenzene 5'-phosphate synthase